MSYRDKRVPLQPKVKIQKVQEKLWIQRDTDTFPKQNNTMDTKTSIQNLFEVVKSKHLGKCITDI